MSDYFDPYFEWLGVDGGGQTPDHYRLLGLNRFESDPELIARAADTAMARVRRIRPGAHLAEWSQLLDHLIATKTCLLNPSSRAAYDESLRSPSSTAAASIAWSSPVAEPPRSFFDAPPPTLESLQFSHGETTVDERPRSPFPVGYSEPPVYAEAGASASPPPGLTDSAHEEPMPMADMAVEFSPIDVQPAPIITSAPAASSSPSVVHLILAGLALLAIGVGAVLGSRMYRLELLAAKSEVAIKSESAPVQSLAAPQPSKTPPKKTADQDDAKKQAEKLEAEKAKAAKLEAEKAKEEAEKAEAEKKKTEAEQAEAEKKKAEAEQAEAEKKKAEAEQAKPALDAKKTEAFTQAVANVRTALAQRDLAAAGKTIKVVAANVQTPEDQDQLDRLGTMLENLKQFWAGIRATMAKLQAAEEIVMNDTRIVVVESGPDLLTVKAEGRIQRFRAATLPTPLVMVLVEQSFGKDPGSRAIVGTFLAVDPNGNRELARRYWQEAARAGIDSEKLLREIDVKASKPSNVDALKGKMAALEESMKTARGMSSYRDIAQTALTLVGEAVAEQRIDEAARLATLAVEAARKSKNTPLMRQATVINQQVQAIQKENSKKK